VARRVESSGTTISSTRPLSAARAAVLAFGDELIDLKLRPYESDSQWLPQGGCDMAAAYLLPRAEAALRQELQRLADAVKRAREGPSFSSSGSRNDVTARGFCCRPKARIALKSVTVFLS
jgi:hypothetical protein